MPEITFTRSDRERKSQAIVYTADGYAGSARLSKTLFVDKQGPATLTISAAEFKAPRQVETAEERKARLKAMPKPTLQEVIDKRQAALDKLRAKAQKQSQAA
ncbi:MAG TPA: hypothetical protein VFP43_16895 [Mesorhizobium sp.]|nr:hypothetical protein [Mesorhizobium sp.]